MLGTLGTMPASSIGLTTSSYIQAGIGSTSPSGYSLSLPETSTWSTCLDILYCIILENKNCYKMSIDTFKSPKLILVISPHRSLELIVLTNAYQILLPGPFDFG